MLDTHFLAIFLTLANLWLISLTQQMALLSLSFFLEECARP